ncbi:hypothetical protein HGRIS_000740 [Hohenbuehelia grisea]|uniref:F-box domain-containing protein n=1 Tax=Hohenbuehelia grisea TaxID=104357 RepID=A0ABR3IPK8_9AGAR
MIFKECHRGVCQNEVEGSPFWVWHEEDLRSPALFPYAVGSVCQRWAQVVTSSPSFWTRLVIFLDTTASDHIDQYIKLSRDLPFYITVLYRDPGKPLSDVEEKSRVYDVIKQILPYFTRCAGLRLEVRRSSSLPSVILDFPVNKLNAGCESDLDLELVCEVDDGVCLGVDWPTRRGVCLKSRELTKLALDGRNFLGMCLGSLAWNFCALSSFSLGPYRADNRGDQPFPTINLLHALSLMSRLKHLTIAGVDLGPLESYYEENVFLNFRMWGLESLTLIGLSCHSLGALFDGLALDWVHDLRIRECVDGVGYHHLPYSHLELPGADRLELDGNDSVINEYCHTSIGNLGIPHLVLKGSDAMCASVLKSVCSDADGDYLPELAKLEVVNCDIEDVAATQQALLAPNVHLILQYTEDIHDGKAALSAPSPAAAAAEHTIIHTLPMTA